MGVPGRSIAPDTAYSGFGDLAAPRHAATALPAEPRWDLAFLGVLLYTFVEYTRLAAMFPVLIPFQVAKVSVGLTALGMLLSRRMPGDRSQGKTLDTLLVLFLVASFFSTLTALSFSVALEAVTDTARWIVLYFLFSRVLSSRWRLGVFMLLFLALNVKLAQFGIRSYFAGLSYGRDEEFLARGIGGGSTGFFANSNDYGVAMVVVWPILGMLVFAKTKLWARLAALAGFLIVFASILVSGSRGSLLGAVCVACVVWLKNPRRLIAPVLMVAVLAVGFVFLPEANKDRVRSAFNWEQDDNAVTRVELWKNGLRMFADYPLLGVGPGNFRIASTYNQISGSTYGVVPDELPDGTPEELQHALVPHSIYIQALAELGVIGTVVFVAMLVTFFRLNNLTRKRAPELGLGRNNFEYCLALALDLGMVAFMANGAFITVLYYPHLWVLLGLASGLNLASSRLKRPETAASPKAAPLQLEWCPES